MSTPFLSLSGIGRLTKDPEQRTVGAHNSKIVSTSIAVNLRVKGVDGQWKDMPQYHNCIMWGAKGESLAKMAKGDLVYFSGEMQIEEWKDQSGAVKTGQKIELTKVVSLAPRSEGGTTRAPAPASRPAARPAQSSFLPTDAPPDDGSDVPF